MVEAIFFTNPGDDSDDSEDSEDSEILEVIDIDIDIDNELLDDDEPDGQERQERQERHLDVWNDGLPFFVDLETGRISSAFSFSFFA